MMAMRFLKPKRLGVLTASWLKAEGLPTLCMAKMRLYLIDWDVGGESRPARAGWTGLDDGAAALFREALPLCTADDIAMGEDARGPLSGRAIKGRGL